MPNVITFAVGSFVSSTAAALGASVATQATLAAFAVAALPTAISIGVTLALGAFAGRPSTPTIKPSDGQIVTSNPVAGRIRSYGRVRSFRPRFDLSAAG